MERPVHRETRRHAIVLVRPLAKALVLAAVGLWLVLGGWPLTPVGAAALALAALLALRAVWRWERTRIVVTGGQLVVVYGTLRRRTAATRVGAIEIDQSAIGRVLGYGTVVAGELEVPFVAHPADLLGSNPRRC
jgi:uncharacterized membrane protein YdbT with pleckstrin-like domain